MITPLTFASYTISALFILPILVGNSGAVKATTEKRNIQILPSDSRFDPEWLKARSAAQTDNIARTKVFYDFKYEDKSKDSGIDFKARVVPDGGIALKPVHYDHGNGIAVADVDNDGLYDIYFTNQVGNNELWKNIGNGQFTNITDDAKVGLPDRVSVSASFADTDNDGDVDLFVTTVRDGNVLFINDGSGKFHDASRQSGLDYKGHSSGAIFFDYDRDGLLDLFVTNVGKYTSDKRVPINTNYSAFRLDQGQTYFEGLPDGFSGHAFPERSERSILYRNLGGNKFIDVSEQTGLLDNSWSGDVSFLDLNEDGWPDLYILNMQGHDEYYENQEGKSFVRKSREHFPFTSWGSMGIKVFDFNNDGLMDIYVTDMHTDMKQDLIPAHEKQKIMPKYVDYKTLGTDGNHILGNSFFRNDGNGKFSEVSDEVNAENYWPWGVSVGDLNADGFQDIFVTASMNMRFRYAVNNLLLNDHGHNFIDSEFVLGVEPRIGRRLSKPWFGYDCRDEDKEDLWHKKKWACKDPEALYIFREALGSRSAVIFDLDNDGDLDIVTNEWNWTPMVLVSDLAENHNIHYLKIRLIGTRSNRDGIGAKVTVFAGGASYTQLHDGKSGYLSQSSYPMYIGLNKATHVDRIEVIWPSGLSQSIDQNIKINSLVEITEQ